MPSDATKDILKKIKLSDIKPYWRNPRVGDIEKVRQSIKDYGYNQYIVVDRDNIIIVGHTRYKALQELALEMPEYKEITVLVSGLDPRKAKEYRIVDNQTGDQSEWILDRLSQELRELDNAVAIKYFTEDELNKLVREGAGAVNFKPVDQEAVQQSGDQLASQMTVLDAQRKRTLRKVICPHCNEEFEIE